MNKRQHLLTKLAESASSLSAIALRGINIEDEQHTADLLFDELAILGAIYQKTVDTLDVMQPSWEHIADIQNETKEDLEAALKELPTA